MDGISSPEKNNIKISNFGEGVLILEHIISCFKFIFLCYFVVLKTCKFQDFGPDSQHPILYMYESGRSYSPVPIMHVCIMLGQFNISL